MAAQGQDASDISAAEAFIPDFHLRRDLRSPEGMAKALQAATQEMAQLFKRIWSENTDLRTYHALGNHEDRTTLGEILAALRVRAHFQVFSIPRSY